MDAEGFPRADIDIAAVRSQRNRLALLRTDYKNTSEALERALYAALPPPENADEPTDSTERSSAPAAPSRRVAPTSSSDTINGPPVIAVGTGSPVGSASDRARVPFAVVDRVDPESPASAALLLVGDRIAAFGAISLRALHSPSAAMSALPATVQGHVNRPLDIIVHRGDGSNFECLTLSITPRRWSGNGLLGCHVTPLNIQEDSRYRPEVAVAFAQR